MNYTADSYTKKSRDGNKTRKFCPTMSLIGYDVSMGDSEGLSRVLSGCDAC